MASTASRGEHWTEEATLALIAIWSEENVQHQLEGLTRNTIVYQEIAKAVLRMFSFTKFRVNALLPFLEQLRVSSERRLRAS